MPWTFLRNADLVEDRPTKDGRRVWIGRAVFSDGNEERCESALFYDTLPNAARRNAARDRILDRLNAPPPERDFIEEYADNLRERIMRTLANGRTKGQILDAIVTRLDQLAE